MENAYKSHSVALNSSTTNKFNGIKLEAVKPPDAIHFEPITLRPVGPCKNRKNHEMIKIIQNNIFSNTYMYGGTTMSVYLRFCIYIKINDYFKSDIHHAYTSIARMLKSYLKYYVHI